jgi:hypothetical protein
MNLDHCFALSSCPLARRRGRTTIAVVPPFFAVMPRRQPSYHIAIDHSRQPIYRLRPRHGDSHGHPRQYTSLLSSRQHLPCKLEAATQRIYKLMPQLAPLSNCAPSEPASPPIILHSSPIWDFPQFCSLRHREPPRRGLSFLLEICPRDNHRDEHISLYP